MEDLDTSDNKNAESADGRQLSKDISKEVVEKVADLSGNGKLTKAQKSAAQKPIKTGKSGQDCIMKHQNRCEYDDRL